MSHHTQFVSPPTRRRATLGALVMAITTLAVAAPAVALDSADSFAFSDEYGAPYRGEPSSIPSGDSGGASSMTASEAARTDGEPAVALASDVAGSNSRGASTSSLVTGLPQIPRAITGSLEPSTQPVAAKNVPAAPPSIPATSTMTEFFSVAAFPVKGDHLRIELAFTKHKLCPEVCQGYVAKQNKIHDSVPSKITTYWKVVSVTAPDGGKVKVELQLVRIELTYSGLFRTDVDVLGVGPGATDNQTIGLLQP